MEEKAQRGIALFVALILLLTLSMLVVLTVNTANAELVMAGNEQYTRNAVNAASAGIEHAMARLASGSELGEVEGTLGADRYVAVVRAAGEETRLPGMSAGKFVGLHYDIESTGYAARGALDVQVQGVLIVETTGGTRTFVQQKDGLEQDVGS